MSGVVGVKKIGKDDVGRKRKRDQNTFQLFIL